MQLAQLDSRVRGPALPLRAARELLELAGQLAEPERLPHARARTGPPGRRARSADARARSSGLAHAALEACRRRAAGERAPARRARCSVLRCSGSCSRSLEQLLVVGRVEPSASVARIPLRSRIARPAPEKYRSKSSSKAGRSAARLTMRRAQRVLHDVARRRARYGAAPASESSVSAARRGCRAGAAARRTRSIFGRRHP